LKRVLRAGLVSGSISACVVLAACGGSPVDLSSQPTDLDSARSLAKQVASTANCSSFEDYSQGTGYWTFTCQTDTQMYAIVAASSTETRDTQLQRSRDQNLPVKTGNFYGVTMFQSPGHVLHAFDLDAFPGQADVLTSG